MSPFLGERAHLEDMLAVHSCHRLIGTKGSEGECCRALDAVKIQSRCLRDIAMIRPMGCYTEDFSGEAKLE